MTVDIAPIHMAFVYWFAQGTKHEGIYPQEELVLVQPVGEDSRDQVA